VSEGARAPADDEREAQEILARYVEACLAGETPDIQRLCADRPELTARVKGLAAAFHAIDGALDMPAVEAPRLEGFRVIERIGRGGAGDVYKAFDLTLGRVVAAKVLRRDSPLTTVLPDFLREARSLALFDDPRIVRLLEFRAGEPAVLLMEYVDGFTLSEIGPSLEFPQRARVVAEVADALHRAHALGLQHRDIKPANVLVDAKLQPKILDFGVSRAEPDRGHGLGTLDYMAPEQLDPSRAIDARADVYALGVVLYELLCGGRPYEGADAAQTLRLIREGRPKLPVEIDPRVPEPLQAIALTAMAAEPADRYPSAREMALDLRRYLEGRPVVARPTIYRSALARRIEPHVEQVAEWERLRLIHPHEGDRLRRAYGQLHAREDDWIVQGRVLSFPQIALYMGAFLLLCSSVLAFLAYLEGAVQGVLWPLAALGLPCVALHLAAHPLYRGSHKAAAVAFYLGAAVLLPPLLLIVFREMGWWPAVPGDATEMFEKVSNQQLQIASFISCAWAATLAARTHTVALSSGFTLLLATFWLTVLGDYGLETWLEEGLWDRLSFHLLPLLAFVAALGAWSERRHRVWFAEPLYFAAASLFVLVLELLAQGGKALAHLGLTLAVPGGTSVDDPTLLDTVAAMTASGAIVYAAASLVERYGTRLQQPVSSLLYAVSPFAILEPLAYLCHTGEYSRRFDWIYLALAVGVAFASRFRQRRSFYYAGLTNTALAIGFITDHNDWTGRPAWTVAVVLAGVTLLAVGLALDNAQRRRRAPHPDALS
jgi:hypothetical protein